MVLMLQTKATWNYKTEWRGLKPQSHYHTQNRSYSKYHAWDSDDTTLECRFTVMKTYLFWSKMSIRWCASAPRAMITPSRSKQMNTSFYNGYPITIRWSSQGFQTLLAWVRLKFKRKKPKPSNIASETIKQKRYGIEVSCHETTKLLGL